MNAPKLRFKEFIHPLENTSFKKVVGSNKYGPRFNAEDYHCNGNVKTIRGTDISLSGDIKYNQVPIARLDNDFIQEHLLKDGDLVMITTADCGLTGVFIKQAIDYIASAYAVKIQLNKFGYPYYFKYYFQTKILKDEINKYIRKATVSNLPLSDITKLCINLPSFPEQTKIANFLTAIDEKITQLTQKYDLLKQYKKGVMQQIFSQKLRFKDEDGREFSDWETKVIGDIFTFIQTNSFSRELLNYETGAVKNIHYGDIHTKFSSNFKIENENVPFINLTVDISKVPAECYCKVGDLVVADASEDYADVGKAIEIINLGNEQLLSGLHTYIARDLSNQMALGFSGYLMQSETVRLQIKTLATGVSVLGISKGNLAKVKIRLPLKSEQTKIANFLTTIDDKITQTQNQLEAVKLYKKGLLQQMFV